MFKFRSRTRRAGPAETAETATLPPTDSYAALLPRELFDEPRYLARNRDVADAVARGETTAYQHYTEYGHLEERRGDRERSVPTESRALSTRARPEGSLIDRITDLEIDKRALFDAWDRNLHRIDRITFDMLADPVDDAVMPPLDRSDCDESKLDDDQRFWRNNGYIIKPGFIPNELIDAYTEIRARHPSKGGWSCPVPYMYINEIRDVSLYPPLMDLMRKLVGEEMGLALNLTNWTSTDRNWHQDDYLNPFFIYSWYAAAWIALDDIHPDSGPFEFVPGSHKWPLMKSTKVRLYLRPDERDTPHWPALAERFINSVAEEEIQSRKLGTERFIARKGDVLIWHGRLMHRGSYAKVPGMERRSLIAHYSGLSHRVDMPNVKWTEDGKAYFDLPMPLDFDPYVQSEPTATA